MAAPVFEKNFTQDIRQKVEARHCGGLMFTGDALADTISVYIYDGQNEYPVSGSVVCNCIRADGATVPVTGSISGNTVQATLTQACCAVQGPLAVIMKVTSGDVTATVLKAIYNVDLGETGTIVDPGTIIPNVADLISDIEAAVASVPADYSDLLATIAPTFSSSTPYAAGDYVWYDGDLYRFTSAHAAGAWTGTDVTTVVIGDEVNELKSAFEGFISGDTKYQPDDIAGLVPYSTDLLYKLSSVTDGVTNAADVPTGIGNAKAYKLALDNVTRITYPVFKSTGGYGSFICDDTDIVIWHYSESITDGMSLKTIDVPENAKYMIFSAPNSFFNGTYTGWYVELFSITMSSLQHAINQLNTDLSSAEDDISDLNEQMALYTDRIIGGKELAQSITWVDGYSISENGSISQNSDFHYSSLISVIDGTYKLVIKGTGVNNNTRIHAYDENGDWLKQILVVGTGTSTDPINVAVQCDGYSYIRISTAKVVSVMSLLSPILIESTPYNPLGLHTLPDSVGVLNSIKRARQMTDIYWTPGADLERAFMDTGDTYLTSHGQTYKGTFVAGTKYKGLPYSERNAPYRWLGIEVPLEAFCSAVEKDDSVIALESTYTQYGADYYGCVCTSLTCYALDLPYTVSTKYSSIPGMIKVADVNDSLNVSLLKLGDILQISGHCAIITDIYTDKSGNVTYIEISEETRQGNSNRSHKTGEYGSVCRRVTMTVSEFISWFASFSVYRYAYIDKVTYRACPYVPMPDEGNRICIHDYPLMPYMGNKTTYGTSTAPTVKLIFDTPDYTTLLVYKDGVQFGQYDVTNQTYYNVVCDTDEAKYTACLAVLGDNNSISYSSQTVEWYCRPHDTPVVSVSGGKATISVSNIGGFKPYCVIIGTTFIDGGYTRLFDGDYTSTASNGVTTYTFQIPFDYAEAESCKLFLRSEEWGVCEYNFTITP